MLTPVILQATPVVLTDEYLAAKKFYLASKKAERKGSEIGERKEAVEENLLPDSETQSQHGSEATLCLFPQHS